MSGSWCAGELVTVNSELVFWSLQCIGTGALPSNSKKIHYTMKVSLVS
jgi:hypothetical protein